MFLTKGAVLQKSWKHGWSFMRPSLFAALCLTSLLCAAADRIAFLRISPTHVDLFISNADGSGERPLTTPDSLNYNPVWSPKGDWVAFASERAGSADLYRIHADGSGLERLTDHPASEPYGEIFVMRYDGTNIEQLTNDQWEEGGPGWQPRAAR